MIRPHPVYRMIDERSWSAVAKFSKKPGSLGLDEVLRAFALDPRRAASYESSPFYVDASYRALQAEGRIDAAIEAVSTWASLRSLPSSTIAQITEWDRRIGVWCACQVARQSVLNAKRFLGRESSRSDDRPLRCIVAAEGWALGEVEDVDLLRAVDLANDSFSYAATAACELSGKGGRAQDKLNARDFRRYVEAKASWEAAKSAASCGELAKSQTIQTTSDYVAQSSADSIGYVEALEDDSHRRYAAYRAEAFRASLAALERFVPVISKACLEFAELKEHARTLEEWLEEVDAYSHLPSRGAKGRAALPWASALLGAAAGASVARLSAMRRPPR